MAIVWLEGSSDAVKTVYTAARILRVSELYTMFQNKIPEGSRHSFLKFFSRSEKKDGGVAIPPGGQRMYVWPLWGCEIKAGEVELGKSIILTNILALSRRLLKVE